MFTCIAYTLNGLGEVGRIKKVSVSENFVTEKSLSFGEFGLGKRVSVLVSENLASVKKSRVWFQKIWSWKKVAVSV